MARGKERQTVEKTLSLEENWDNPQIFSAYDRYRALFRPATSAVVNRLLAEYVPPHGINVEIGSGMGELLHNLIPDGSPYKGIIQTEQGKKIIAQREKGVMPVNVYQLGNHFPPETVDTFIGFASFDTFANLDQAVGNMVTALKQGGRIIHFVDIIPSPNTILHEFDSQKSKQVPLPWLDEGENITGVAMVERSALADRMARAKLPRDQQLLINRYLRNPPEEYVTLEGAGQLALFARFLARLLGESEVEVVRFDDYFAKNMQAALKKEQLEIERFGVEEETVTIPPANPRVSDSNSLPFNTYINDIGSGIQTNAPYLSPGEVRITSKLHTVVARKAA